jgi:membrane protease YdiL (CAAX protease family)
MNTTTNILAVVAGILYPIYCAISTLQSAKRITKDEKYRLGDYFRTIFVFWALTILIVINFYIFKQPTLNFYPKITLINLLLIVLVFSFAILQYRSGGKITINDVQNVREKLKDIYYYLPKTHKELVVFILISLSAGVCEEIIFRLFLFHFLNEYLYTIGAIVLTNLIFTFTHIGSGKSNLIFSFILGLLFSTLYYYTNNIWIAVLLHISIDINVGILGYKLSVLENTILNKIAN